jgi:hypothetical protein
MKRLAIMASKTSGIDREKATMMSDFGRELAARRAALGNPELPRNSGKRRTASKKALLKAIEATGKRW